MNIKRSEPIPAGSLPATAQLTEESRALTGITAGSLTSASTGLFVLLGREGIAGTFSPEEIATLTAAARLIADKANVLRAGRPRTAKVRMPSRSELRSRLVESRR